VSTGKIFLIDEHGEPVKEMAERPYESEEILQRLLEGTPDLLPGEQMNPDAPRNWLLVKRELGVPDGEDKSDRWSVDHLFLDQDGTPTFIECKRASNSRARREVVAQMLDYAANGLVYWSMDALRQAAAETAPIAKKSLNGEVERLIGSARPDDIESYWKKVEQNLREGKARLIFVADKIPSELKRLVEFLNEKMSDLEVLAIEVAQYTGEGLRALVPRIIGLTEKARTTLRGQVRL
jgi:hypothetical protein